MEEFYDRGYDPTVQEAIPTEQVRLLEKLPKAQIVNPAFLPPVGQQGTVLKEGSPGSCCAWANVYGLATFTAARAGLVDPSLPSGQASPAQIYIEALKGRKAGAGHCSDTSPLQYFDILRVSGTQTMADAPYVPDCNALWLAYGNGGAKPKEVFRINTVSAVKTNDLESLKHVLASGRALSYGTRLFSDFKDYSGGKSPYWGNGDVIVNKKHDRPAGHCMLIIGYDDGVGAVLIQNSEGREWGIDGFIWMAYSTFEFLAQGQALYVKDK